MLAVGRNQKFGEIPGNLLGLLLFLVVKFGTQPKPLVGFICFGAIHVALGADRKLDIVARAHKVPYFSIGARLLVPELVAGESNDL